MSLLDYIIKYVLSSMLKLLWINSNLNFYLKIIFLYLEEVGGEIYV